MSFRPTAFYAIASVISEDQASSLIEFALMLPILAVLLVGAVDLGRAWYVDMEVASAAEAGALYGVHNPADLAGMKTAAARDAQDINALSVSATYGTECSDGTSVVPLSTSIPSCSANSVEYVEVDTTATYTPIIAYPGFSSIMTMAGKSRMRTSF